MNSGDISKAVEDRENEIIRLAGQLHHAEHDGGSAAECDVDWHTSTWFEHVAEQVYRTGRRD